MSEPLVTLSDVSIRRAGRNSPILDNFSLTLAAGETVVLLGETRSGADALARALSGVPSASEAIAGSIRIGNRSSLAGDIAPYKAARIAYWPAPEHALAPNASALAQLVRVVARKLSFSQAEARAEFAASLERLRSRVTIQDLARPAALVSPDVLSWGLLACAVAQSPELLIADHPAGNVAPSVAGALVAACLEAQKRQHFALVCVTPRVDVTRRIDARTIILRSGRMIEEGSIAQLAGEHAHTYTRALFHTQLSPDAAPARPVGRGEPVLQVFNLLTKGKKADRRDALTFALRRGASLALVGDEGSGRRALMRVLLGFERPAEGRIVFDSVDVGILSSTMLSRLRRRMAVIAGEDGALDPRLTVHDTVEEPLRARLHLTRELLNNYRDAALKRVGLAELDGSRLVAQLGPFDKRRLQVARAIVGAPLLVILDEPWRGLDALARNAMRQLLVDFRKAEGPAFLVVTNDFAVASALAEEALMFDDGKIVERGLLADLVKNPKEAATQRLVTAAKGGLS
ncbi:MAG TPA: ATP-binding cassette domain-containing protein [Rhizomicrobium sp.]|nr:ATP-binding cassette domain-containing protein [Rhizomicrobium sp.]